MSRVVAYIRVSSLAQDHGMQRHAIEHLAAARGDTIGHWYAEKASATHTLTRPALDKLRADVRAGTVARVYVYRLDRLARTGIRDTFEVIEEARAHGVELVSVADGFDLQGPAADVIIAVMAWAAKQENTVRRERIAAARKRVEAEGGTWGRPPRMTPAQVERAQAMKQAGKSVRAIARALKIPHATVARAVPGPTVQP